MENHDRGSMQTRSTCETTRPLMPTPHLLLAPMPGEEAISVLLPHSWVFFCAPHFGGLMLLPVHT